MSAEDGGDRPFQVNVPGYPQSLYALLRRHREVERIRTEVSTKSLSSFTNANRRFQLKHRTDHLTVIDDYAHHPSEIRATLLAARKLADKLDAKLIAVFQPHLYSRTEAFYKDFAKSLSRADMVVLTEIYAAREQNTNNISTKIIYDEIVKILGSDRVIYSRSLDEVPESLQPYLTSDAIVVTLGAGDVWKVSEMFHSSAN
jgi:UDP-N-acetylmuramate--alanine ligase